MIAKFSKKSEKARGRFHLGNKIKKKKKNFLTNQNKSVLSKLTDDESTHVAKTFNCLGEKVAEVRKERKRKREVAQRPNGSGQSFKAPRRFSGLPVSIFKCLRRIQVAAPRLPFELLKIMDRNYGITLV